VNIAESSRLSDESKSQPAKAPRIVIIGAGPIGLEAALYAKTLGHDVTVFDKGSVAANIQSWGHIRLFSPWKYNRSSLGVKRLREEGLGNTDLPDETCPTGEELVDNYLAPLASLPELSDLVREHHEVLACGRAHFLKKDMGQGINRAQDPFQLLIREKDSQERIETADIVIDATGVYGEHNYLGAGGIPAPGETSVTDEVEFNPPDVLGSARDKYAGKHTVVLGAGYSGATTVVALGELMKSAPGTQITWVCRTDSDQPMKAIPDDPLPERRTLTEIGNKLARHSVEGFHYLGGHSVAAIERKGDGLLLNVRNSGDETVAIECDRLVANVGYHPNEKIYRQLQVHECYATLGPIDLAASLMGQDLVDCLAVQAGVADLLRTPEPNFYILGAKSFGMNPNFLIYLGHEHIAQLFSMISGDETLNLYLT